MKAIIVNKDELVEKVRANREKHQAIFDEAVTGYQKQAVQLLEDHIKRIRDGDMVEVYVRLPRPVNQLKDYDRVLAMLEMHLEDEIEVGEDDFASYVMDDWGWKQNFLASNAAYSVTAKKMSESL